jgi:hypothetical protein
MITPRVGARANGDESIETIGIRQRASGTGEIRVERRIVLITMMTVTASGIGLPHLDQAVRDGTTVLIHHAPANKNPLTNRLTGMLAS